MMGSDDGYMAAPPPRMGSHPRAGPGPYMDAMQPHQQHMDDQMGPPGWHHHGPPMNQMPQQMPHGGHYGNQSPPPEQPPAGPGLGGPLDLNQPAPGSQVGQQGGLGPLSSELLLQQCVAPRIGYYNGKPQLILTLPKGVSSLMMGDGRMVGGAQGDMMGGALGQVGGEVRCCKVWVCGAGGREGVELQWGLEVLPCDGGVVAHRLVCALLACHAAASPAPARNTHPCHLH